MQSKGASDESLTNEEDAPDNKDAAGCPSMEGVTRHSTGKDNARSAVRGGYYDNMVADNFNNIVGTIYSKQKFPSREKDRISDAKDERGLHSDRLLTFSFSSSQPMPKKNTLVPNKYAAESLGEAPSNVRNFNQSFVIDNFHNLVDVSMSKPSQANRPNPSSTPNGLDNHADRLLTFLLSAKEDAPSVKSVSGSSSSFKAVNHNNRLGTFSFASMDPQSGSTSSRSTSASSPLPRIGKSNLSPPQTKAEGSPPPTKGSNESKIKVYTSPQKGSLSLIASLISIKSRNDCIKDIKEATDPGLLHPNGMNVLRLNSKEDVMTLSSTGGRLNIFQRINKVKQEIKIEGDNVPNGDPRDINNSIKYETNSSVIEDFANVGIK